MTVTIDLDESAIMRKVGDSIGRAQLVIDNRIAADSNYFCPLAEGYLQGSVFPVQGDGTLVWNDPKAHNHYYEGGTFKEGDGPKATTWKRNKSNPNAAPLWFEHAKARNLKDWEKLANEEYNR